MAPLLRPLALLVIIHDDTDDGKWIGIECGNAVLHQVTSALLFDALSFLTTFPTGRWLITCGYSGVCRMPVPVA
jgi:hypothetical protein